MSENAQRASGPEELVAPVQAPAPEISRPGLALILWQRRWTVALATLLLLAAGLTYLLKATPIYTSMSRLYVEQQGPKVFSEAQGVMTESKNYLYTQGELLTSTPILASVLEDPDISKMKTFEDVDNLLIYLKKELDVTVGKKNDIISVAFDSPYPQEAAHLVNRLVEAYITYHARQKRSTALEVLKILRKDKDKYDKELGEQLKAMLAFKQEHKTLSFERDKGNIVLERLAKLSDALTGAQLDMIDTKAAYDAVKAMMTDPAKVKQLVQAQHTTGVYISFDREETEIRTDLNRLEVQLVAVKREYTADSPRLQVLQGKINELKAQLADRDHRFAGAYLAAIGQQWQTAIKRHQELQAEFLRQQDLAQDLNVKAAEYSILESGRQRIESRCNILDGQIKDINVTEETGGLNISILEVAEPEDKPSKPKKARVLAASLVLGLMLGVALALLRDWRDQRLRSSEEIMATLGIPVLGVVPHIGGKGKADPVERAQGVHRDPQSHMAEAYRTIRTGVYFGVPSGQAKTLLITSPAPGDGKTTMASNLAIAMAQAGQRVLLIDGDFRRPMLHTVFQVPDDVGLSSLLAGRADRQEALVCTEIERLDLLPCGPIPPNPSEMLNSRVFADLLGELAGEYDHIVIDSPPVMPMTDARILGAMCQVTILVLRAEKSTRKPAEQACEGLLSVGARILGAVVNDVPRHRPHYGYGYGYGYGHGYGHYGSYRGRSKEEDRKDAADRATDTAAAGGPE